MDLSRMEENCAMKIYLGGADGRYDPVDRDGRLRKEFGPEWRAVKEALDEYLQALISRPEDWNRESVDEAAARMDAIIEEHFPWFDETARGLLVGCFVYEWK